jgi:hypothetical protein
MRSFIKPPWWWHGAGIESGEVFFNKRAHLLLRFVWFSLMLPPLPSVHGGLEKGGLPATSNMMGEDWGIPIESELIHDRGKLASTILCRQGGAISTSSEEALISFRYGCSKSLGHEVMRSPWLRDGPWLRIVAGKGSRAAGSGSSTVTPGGRRRRVVEVPRDCSA